MEEYINLFKVTYISIIGSVTVSQIVPGGSEEEAAQRLYAQTQGRVIDIELFGDANDVNT